jgi:hypothetical protein
MNPAFLVQTQNPLIVSAGLLGYWSFNEGTGNKAYDFSGNNRHGTLVGVPTRVNGFVGGALSFNGSTQYVDTVNLLSAVTTFSFSVWLKPTALADWKGIVSKYVDDNHCITLQTNTAGNIALDVDDTVAGSNYGQTGTGILANGKWSHIVMTYDGAGAANADRIKLYVNNVATVVNFTGDIVTTTYTGTETVQIGRLEASTLLNGVIDEVRIYNRPLTPFEVTLLYNR